MGSDERSGELDKAHQEFDGCTDVEVHMNGSNGANAELSDAYQGVGLGTTPLEMAESEINVGKQEQIGMWREGKSKLNKATNGMNATLSQNV